MPSLFKRQNEEYWLAVAENRVFLGQSTSTNISIGEHLTGEQDADDAEALFNRETWIAAAPTLDPFPVAPLWSLSIWIEGYAWSAVDWTVGCNTNSVRGPVWKMLDASGVNSESRRIIWLMDSKNRLYCYHQHQLEHISLPTEATVAQVRFLPPNRIFLVFFL